MKRIAITVLLLGVGARRLPSDLVAQTKPRI
jgi:hypothetical protein